MSVRRKRSVPMPISSVSVVTVSLRRAVVPVQRSAPIPNSIASMVPVFQRVARFHAKMMMSAETRNTAMAENASINAKHRMDARITVRATHR